MRRRRLDPRSQDRDPQDHRLQQRSLLLERDLAAECEALPAADLHQLCNGHDLLGLLAAGLAALGSGNKPKADALAEALATACERAWLLTTAMWRAIESWERAHPGYQVLRQDPD